MRTRSLTIKEIKIYKAVILSLLAVFIFAVVYFYMIESGRLSGLIMVLPYILIFYRSWKSFKLLKQVSYDEQNLYVQQDDFESQIPFYRIKNVELISLDGVYKFVLIDNDQFGDTVLCKPSIWYPFTYKKVDKELQEIRNRIAKVKELYWQDRDQQSGPLLSGMNI